ncbi:MAG: PTS glucose transporter subunit IIA [Lachnospiraceae bacterium]|nr:PTS glucose transporter subunit IIA [Lachnospiraceae bacterium]
MVAAQTGKAVKLEEVPDQVFSQKMLGEGIAVIPSDNVVKSPVKGEIIMIPDTLHAYGIRTEDGVELIVHIGLDTVNLQGKGFTPQVKVGDQVEAGTPLCIVDKSMISDPQKPLYTPVIITNMSIVKNLTIHTGDVKAGETCVIEYEL